MKEKANNRIGIRVTDDLRQKLEQRAEEEGRTMSNFIINTLTKYLDEIERAKEILNKK